MPKLLILADDLTGALDTAIPFADRGIPTCVETAQSYAPGCIDPAAQVLVLNTETRHLPPQAAAGIVLGISQSATARAETLFKKTDSALRGNVAGELAAMLKGSGADELLFFPAHPRMGRTTKQGVHYIDQVPVAESVFGRDPFEPVNTSYIPGMFPAESGVEILVVPAGGPYTPPRPGQKRIVVFDAECEQDIRHGLAVWGAHGGIRCLAGCAGLAAVLAAQWPGEISKKDSPPVKAEGLLVLCGSLNPITLRQLDRAQQAGFARIHLNHRQLLEPAYLDSDDGRRFLRQLEQRCRSGIPLILDALDEEGPRRIAQYASAQGIAAADVRTAISKRFGQLLGSWLAFGLPHAVLVSGGDTLLGCVAALGHPRLVPRRELQPGAPLVFLQAGGRAVPLISKSGGFGGESLLLDVIAMLGIALSGEAHL